MRKLFYSKFIGNCCVFLYICALLLVSERPGFGQTVEQKPAADLAITTPAIEKLIRDQLADGNYVGGSIAVMHHGKIVFAKGFGKRSLKSGKSVDSKTRFNIGSVSKQFTCAAVLLLAEEGKLSVDDRLAKYFPELPHAEKITLLDLMNHVSGYPDYYPLDFLDRRMLAPISPAKLIETYTAGNLDFEPGAEFSYSNTGYVILGRVVEKVSQKALGDFFAARFFRPLGLEDTFFEPVRRDARFADGHTTYALSDPETAVEEGRGWSFGAGGIFSTATDLAKWDLALMDGKVLKPAGLKIMTTRRVLAGGDVKNYGCGLEIENVAGDTIWTHGGASSGFTARNTMIPSTRSAVVLLSNADFALPGAVLHGRFLRSLVVKQIAPAAKTVKNMSSPKKPGLLEVKGVTAQEAAKLIFRQLQTGNLDRRSIGEEFNYFLNAGRLRKAREKLQAFGEPTEVKILYLGERGKMESSGLEFIFPNGKLNASMSRSLDGKIQQFFIRR